ncbi:MAG: glycosyltransferase family 4 protein [Gammaproteobacteria bacterium]|jgi:glycosyltransferase involved in cell wall biosynthesis
MKVVHLVLSESFAGIEQHVDELLSNNLLNNPILICNESIAKNFNNNIKIFEFKNIGRRSLYGKYKLKKLIKSINPDIVHTHGSKTTSLISSINNGSYKHIATIHGIKKNKKVYEKADYVIGVSKKSIENIKNDNKVISNWWYPKLTKLKSKGHKYALAVGRLEKVKGYDLLISSWKKINMDLVIVGSGKEKQNLENLINNSDLSSKIKILDNVQRDELMKFYSDAKLLVVSSRNEGGPRVALEALYLEIPVLSTDVGHMRSILPDELLAVPDDEESLKELLEKYVDNIEILNQEAIFEYVTNEYSIDEKIKQIKDVYSYLLKS